MKQTMDLDRLEARLEELKDDLHRIDKDLFDKLGFSDKPSPQDKKARNKVVREINKVRRQIYHLTKPASARMKKITVSLSEEEIDFLSRQAADEGIDLKIFLRRKLTEDF